MTHLLRGVIMMATVGAVGGVANAIELRNEDDHGYRVTITSRTLQRDVELDRYSMALVVCVGECTFEVPGVGLVRARHDATVTLQHGRLSVSAPTGTSATDETPGARTTQPRFPVARAR